MGLHGALVGDTLQQGGFGRTFGRTQTSEYIQFPRRGCGDVVVFSVRDVFHFGEGAVGRDVQGGEEGCFALGESGVGFFYHVHGGLVVEVVDQRGVDEVPQVLVGEEFLPRTKGHVGRIGRDIRAVQIVRVHFGRLVRSVDVAGGECQHQGQHGKYLYVDRFHVLSVIGFMPPLLPDRSF